MTNVYKIFGLLALLAFTVALSSCAVRYPVKKAGVAQSIPDSLLTGSGEEAPDAGDEEENPANEVTYSIDAAFKSFKAPSGLDANFTDAVDNVKIAIIRYKNTPYVWGGTSLDGVDCSGFTQSVYVEAFRKKLPRTAREQFTVGDHISRSDLKFGDLIFFDTRRRVRPGHVGIFLWGDLFVHSSSKKGVIISSLNESYYDRKYMGGRRVLELGQ